MGRPKIHTESYYTRNKAEHSAKMKAYYAKNRDAMRAKMKEWREKNKDAIAAKKKASYDKEANAARCKAWATKNKEKLAAYQKNWHAENGEAYRILNQEKMKAAQKRYRSKPESREKVNAWRRSYSNRRYKDDFQFRLMRKLRPRLRKLLRSQDATKNQQTFALIGCTPEFLLGYLEAQFKPGWTWDEVHIDHHIPCCAFDLTDPKQQEQCFNYSNLRPMLAIDNLKKGSKLPYQI